MNVSSCIDIRFSVVVNECDEICHLGRNESSEFITLCQLIHALEDTYGRGDNFFRDHNSLLESDNPAMKIFKLFSVIEGQGG